MDQTTTTDLTIASGLLLERFEGAIVLGLPGTDYQLHLAADESMSAAPGTRLSGRIGARARRVDKAGGGGRYIEPVYGRPRRLQGRIAAADHVANTITVHCVCPVVCELVSDQRAADFHIGDFVTFDVERGARFQIA